MISKSYRHIVASSLMVLILFSTIGFNIITTFCGGCDDEHVTVAFIPSEEVEELCECCGEADDELSCCKIDDTENPRTREHPHSQSFFAKLDIDATMVKSKSPQLKKIDKTLHAIIIAGSPTANKYHKSYVHAVKRTIATTGRDILARLCVMLH